MLPTCFWSPLEKPRAFKRRLTLHPIQSHAHYLRHLNPFRHFLSSIPHKPEPLLQFPYPRPSRDDLVQYTYHTIQAPQSLLVTVHQLLVVLVFAFLSLLIILRFFLGGKLALLKALASLVVRFPISQPQPRKIRTTLGVTAAVRGTRTKMKDL